MMPKFSNLIGKRSGRLVVSKRVKNDKWGNSRWLCWCDCGKEKIIRGGDLRSGDTKSCGCLRKEAAILQMTKHGHAKKGKETGFYHSWYSMIQRCINPNSKAYHNYGGRGITVCEEWLHSFPNFLRDNPGWKPGLTLERDKNELGYFPSNCYWATPQEQARNRRDNLYVPYKGEKRLLIELCEEYNIPYSVVYRRIYKYGWSLKKALTTLIKQYKKRRKNDE